MRIKTYVIYNPGGGWLGDPFKDTRNDAERIARQRVSEIKGKSGHYTGGYQLRVFGSTRATIKEL